MFYSEFIIHQALYYTALTGLITVIYFGSSFLITLLLRELFGLTDNLVNVVSILIIAASFSSLKSAAQSFVDRAYYRNKLNYSFLLKEWMNKLVAHNSNLSDLIILLTKDLSKEFQYQSTGILLVDDSSGRVFRFLGNSSKISWQEATLKSSSNGSHNYSGNDSQEGETEVAQYRLLLASFDLTPATGSTSRATSSASNAADRARNKGVFEQLINFKNLRKARLRVEASDLSQLPPFLFASQDIIKDSVAIEGLNTERYTFFIPFNRQGSIIGGLFFGGKCSGRIPSPQEFDTLVSLVWQSSMALNGALKLQLEYSLRRLIQAFIVKQDELRDKEELKLVRDVHDGLGADIALIESRLSTWLEMLGESEPEPMEYGAYQHQKMPDSTLIRQALERSKALRGHLRALLRNLRPIPLEFGLVVALKDFMLAVQELHPGIKFGLDNRLSEEQEQQVENSFEEEQLRHIYRVINEAVNNVVTHSGATTITVVLNWREVSGSSNYFLVEIKDNGKGFDKVMQPQALIRSNHYGLVSMQERVEFLGGFLNLSNYTNKDGSVGGALVSAGFPVNSGDKKLQESEPGYQDNRPFDEISSSLLPDYGIN
ncbi:MAG TPA: ATP-binding protein [Chloroflexia bacterium]|nr:ATP-binding protein [Chloroflexia bacterium]